MAISLPGLADLRDSVLEKQAYSESIDTESGAVIPTSANEILIEEDTIYYLGETVSDAELSDQLDSAGGDTVTLIDHYATQRTWDIVYQLVENKGFAIKRRILTIIKTAFSGFFHALTAKINIVRMTNEVETL